MAGKSNSKTSIIAVVAILVVVLAGFGIWRLLGASAEASYAIVHDGDGGTTVLSLAEAGETTITTSFGTNVVNVADGSVWVSEADCPNHDCIKQGTIDSVGQQVVCLPHELWIEIVTADSNASDADVLELAGTQTADDFDTVGR